VRTPNKGLVVNSAKRGSVNFSLAFLTATSMNASAGDAFLYVCTEVAKHCKYSSVKESIDSASAGDTIVIGPGIFKEALFLATSRCR
jgi:hypothetical protein